MKRVALKGLNYCLKKSYGGLAPLSKNFLKRDFNRRNREVERVLPDGYSIRRLGNISPFVMAIVPQGENWIMETLGKFSRVLEPGLHFLIPFVQRVAFKHSRKEITFIIHKQTAITRDNVYIEIDGICYVRMNDVIKASYEVENPFFAITNLAQTTMRSEIGKISLDETFEERQTLNDYIVNAISDAAYKWGITVERYEIRDIAVPENIKKAMELEAEAERRKRQQILDSEAKRTAAQNVAQGQREAKRLISEAEQISQENLAKGKAFAIERVAQAQATAIEKIAGTISESECGEDAVAFEIAKKFCEAYGEIAKEGNTIILPADQNVVPSLVASALSIFEAVSKNTGGKGEKEGGFKNEGDI